MIRLIIVSNTLILNKSPREALIRWLQKPNNQSLWKQVHLWIVAHFLQVLDGAAGSIIVSSFGPAGRAAAANKAAKNKMQNNFNPYSGYDSTY